MKLSLHLSLQFLFSSHTTSTHHLHTPPPTTAPAHGCCVLLQVGTLTENGAGSPGGIRYNRRSAGVVYTDGLQVAMPHATLHVAGHVAVVWW